MDNDINIGAPLICKRGCHLLLEGSTYQPIYDPDTPNGCVTIRISPTRVVGFDRERFIKDSSNKASGECFSSENKSTIKMDKTCTCASDISDINKMCDNCKNDYSNYLDKKCVNCKKPFTNKNVYSRAGWAEVKITQLCELCFDSITKEEKEDEF